MKARRKARCLALQVLYEMDCAGHALDEAFRYQSADAALTEQQAVFALRLVEGAWGQRAWLDQVIHRHAPEWPLSQMAYVDRNVLRIAIWEFALSGDTPLKVAINEAVELAKRFGSDSSSRFVNGVLGALAAKENDVRQQLAAKVKKEAKAI
ncbi:MAG: transcription antitermination factor NusB [Anaerolineales bacterium]|jgi:N utilization substance protein B|nr:transcription antitermination factor NusB [Anaerolineales bacterium]